MPGQIRVCHRSFTSKKMGIGTKAKDCTCFFLGWKLRNTAAFLGYKDLCPGEPPKAMIYDYREKNFGAK